MGPGTTVPWPLQQSIHVVQKQDTTVTFEISNQFDTESSSLRWLQVVYPTDDGELCVTYENLKHGDRTGPITATCMAGVCSSVKVYVAFGDANTDDVLGKNSESFVSELCTAQLDDDSSVKSTAGYFMFMACNAECSLDVATQRNRRALAVKAMSHQLPRPIDFVAYRRLQERPSEQKTNGAYMLQINTAEGIFDETSASPPPLISQMASVFGVAIGTLALLIAGYMS